MLLHALFGLGVVGLVTQTRSDWDGRVRISVPEVAESS
jgi:hypothetical protein